MGYHITYYSLITDGQCLPVFQYSSGDRLRISHALSNSFFVPRGSVSMALTLTRVSRLHARRTRPDPGVERHLRSTHGRGQQHRCPLHHHRARQPLPDSVQPDQLHARLHEAHEIRDLGDRGGMSGRPAGELVQERQWGAAR